MRKRTEGSGSTAASSFKRAPMLAGRGMVYSHRFGRRGGRPGFEEGGGRVGEDAHGGKQGPAARDGRNSGGGDLCSAQLDSSWKRRRKETETG